MEDGCEELSLCRHPQRKADRESQAERVAQHNQQSYDQYQLIGQERKSRTNAFPQGGIPPPSWL